MLNKLRQKINIVLTISFSFLILISPLLTSIVLAQTASPSATLTPTDTPSPTEEISPTTLPEPTTSIIPSVIPTSSPTPTSTPTAEITKPQDSQLNAGVMENLQARAAATEDSCFYRLQPEETKLISKNCRIVGDVKVSTNQSSRFDTLYDFERDEQGTPSYDTGLVVSLSQDAWVKAPYGAIISSASPQELINILKTSGCSGGCQSVLHVAWTPALSVCDKNLAPGEVAFVKSECNVVGDTENTRFGGYQEKKDFAFRNYDDNPKTSHVKTVPTDGNLWVRAPYGASLSSRAAAQIISELKASGCGGGCEIVYHDDLNPVSLCYNFGVIPAGQYRILNEGCSVVGDVEIMPAFGPNTKLYDNDGKTGLIVVIKERTLVSAPFSAYISGRTTEDLTNQLKSTGCGGGCSSVKVVNWPQ